MSSFSPSDAAFEGFRLTRERPRAVLAWALCYLLFTYLISAIADVTLGPQSKALLADLQHASADPAAFWPAAQKMAPFFLAGLPLNLAFQAIFTCAVYRAILRPQEASRGYLRLGFDELRMMALNLILTVIWMVVIFAFLLVFLFSAAVAGAANGPVTILIGDIATVAAFCAGGTIVIRLSLAGPMTFADRRLQVFGSWSKSKGVFWRLAGAFVLSLILAVIVLLLMLLVVGAAVNILTDVTGLPLTSLNAASSSPLVVAVALLSQAVTVLVLTCFNVVLKAWPAQAYKGVIGAPAADVSS